MVFVLVREESTCTKVVLWSRVLFWVVSMRAYCIYFSWALVMSFVDELAVVQPFLFGLWFCSSLSWAVFRVRRIGGFELVSAGETRRRPGRAPCCFFWSLQFFALFLALSALAFSLLSGWKSCSCLSRWLPAVFLRHFRSCGVPARRIDLRHVFLDICSK